MGLLERIAEKITEKPRPPATMEKHSGPEQSMVPVSINGQDVLVPRTCTGRQLREAAGSGRGRMLVLHRIESHLVIQVRDNDVLDVSECAEFEDLPIGKWGGPANAERKLVEFRMVQAWYGQSDYDDVELSWLRIQALPLPKGKWNKPATGLLLKIPAPYPQIPPSQFYLDNDLRDHRGKPPDHLFQRNPYEGKGWAYYCLLLERNWRPSRDINGGDNLFKVIERIRAGLS